MKYRIKEVKKNGKSKFYPQHLFRLFWIFPMWWTYDRHTHPECSDEIYFYDIDEARRFLGRHSQVTTIKYHDYIYDEHPGKKIQQLTEEFFFEKDGLDKN
jgi:hypothetical protein